MALNEASDQPARSITFAFPCNSFLMTSSIELVAGRSIAVKLASRIPNHAMERDSSRER